MSPLVYLYTCLSQDYIYFRWHQKWFGNDEPHSQTLSTKNITSSQSSSPQYVTKQTIEMSSPGQWVPGTNERPGLARVGLGLGAVVGQEVIPSLTSGRATTAQPAWAHEDPFGSKTLTMGIYGKDLLTDVFGEAITTGIFGRTLIMGIYGKDLLTDIFSKAITTMA